MDLDVVRGGENKVKVKVPVTKAPLPPVEELLLTKMGIKGQTVTAAVQARYKLAIGQGVYVESVVADSPAAKCGMQAGDVLLQLGRYRVNSIEDVATLLKTVTQPTDVPVQVVRGNTLGPGIISLK